MVLMVLHGWSAPFDRAYLLAVTFDDITEEYDGRGRPQTSQARWPSTMRRRVEPFIAARVSPPAAAKQELVSPDRKPKLGRQTGAGTYCLPSPISQVTRCAGGVEHAGGSPLPPRAPSLPIVLIQSNSARAAICCSARAYSAD